MPQKFIDLKCNSESLLQVRNTDEEKHLKSGKNGYDWKTVQINMSPISYQRFLSHTQAWNQDRVWLKVTGMIWLRFSLSTCFYFYLITFSLMHAPQKSILLKKKHEEMHLVLMNEKINILNMKLMLFSILTSFKLWEKVEIYG